MNSLFNKVHLFIDKHGDFFAIAFVLIFLVLPVATVIGLTLREYTVLEKEGVFVKGIIDNCTNRGSSYSFNVANKTYIGSTVRSSKDCHFYCGDTITIVYRPSDPEMNMPACNVFNAYLHESYTYRKQQ